MQEGGEKDPAFEADEGDFLEAAIDNVSVSNLGFIVFLKAVTDAEGTTGRVLPIFIGANEAHSIALAYNNQEAPRPLTHDLLKNILGMLDCEVVKVQVTALSENTFFGRIHLKREGFDEFDVDARPSDAIALALRYKVPIFVHKDVYESAAIHVKDKETEGSEAAPEAEPAPSRSAPSDPRDRLKEKLEKALAEERYEEAARIRDELKRLESGN